LTVLRQRFRLAAERCELRVRGRTSLHPIRAAADRVDGWIDLAGGVPEAGTMRVDTARLRTGNPLFDREIDRRLESDAHPAITGELDRAQPGAGPGQYRLAGRLTIHGVTREVDGEVEVVVGPDELRITGEQRFRLADFEIEPPEVLTFRVDPTVLVRLDLVAVA
jgi:polyisoprenoid-binding protein YceI